MSEVVDWNIHQAEGAFKASKVTYDCLPIVSVPEQYTPEVRVSPDSSPLTKMCLQNAADAALKAIEKSVAHEAVAAVPT